MNPPLGLEGKTLLPLPSFFDYRTHACEPAGKAVMLCDIEADFCSNPMDAHVVNGVLRLSDLEDRKVCQVTVDLVGRITYLCPSFNTASNFMDPEKPSYTTKQCNFLTLSHTFANTDFIDNLAFHFDVPHYVELNREMRNRLGLRNSTTPSRYRLPPTFADESHSYLQSLFVPWKETSKATVRYKIQVTVSWVRRAGMSRILGPNCQKSFRKPIVVVPSSMEEVQTILPSYSAKSNRHWLREPCNTSDGLGGICSVFVCKRAKLSVYGDTRLMVERPLLFCLELNGNLNTDNSTVVTIQLHRIVSTKVFSARVDLEKRGNATVVDQLHIYPSPDQAAANQGGPISRPINVAHFDTSDRRLNGAMHLVESSKNNHLSPAFTFADVAVEYRLLVRVSSGQSHLSFFTPPVTLDIESEDCPPPYSSSPI